MTDPLDDPGVVTFAGTPPAPEPGEFVAHSLKDKLFGRSLEDVKADWRKLSHQVAEMVTATSPIKAAGFEVESLEIGLGFTASGKLAFIAEASVEATVTITLTRAGRS
jgi:hypothetical protein